MNWKEEIMAKNHTKIMISIPIELNNLLSELVEASKNTPKPITKSSLVVVAIYEYLAEANKTLKSINTKGVN